MSLGNVPLRLFPGDIAVVSEGDQNRRYRVLEVGATRILIEPIEGTAEGQSALKRLDAGDWYVKGARDQFKITFEAGVVPSPDSSIEGYVAILTTEDGDSVVSDLYMSRQDAIEAGIEMIRQSWWTGYFEDESDDYDGGRGPSDVYDTVDDYVQALRHYLDVNGNLRRFVPSIGDEVEIEQKKIWEPRAVSMTKPARR